MKTSISHFSPRSESIPEALSIYINELVFDQKRKGIDLNSDVDESPSRTTLDIDNNNNFQIRSNNSFLHDNVD